MLTAQKGKLASTLENATNLVAFRDIVRQHAPDLLVFLKPAWLALRALVRGPGPRDCVASFARIRHVEPAVVDEIVRSLGELPTVYFAQIGSNDGKSNDPIFQYASVSPKWRGVLVEPVPFLFNRLKENYRQRAADLTFERVAVSSASGAVTFYHVSEAAQRDLPHLPEWSTQIGSFTKHHIVKHLGEQILPYIVAEKIETVTLPELLERNHLVQLDLLHIDAEGHDLEILKQLDLRHVRPLVIIVEFFHLSYYDAYRLIRLLRDGYDLFSNDEDLIAVDRAALGARLSA
jgi:FkbM family methyltransferase